MSLEGGVGEDEEANLEERRVCLSDLILFYSIPSIGGKRVFRFRKPARAWAELASLENGLGVESL